MVRVDVALCVAWLMKTLLGFTALVRVLFAGVAARVTVPLKIPTRETMMVELFVLPTITISGAGLTAKLKPDFKTINVIVTVWVRLMLVPVMLMG